MKGMYETKTDWFIMVNPQAGSGKTMHVWAKAEKLLHEKGVPFTYVFTEHKCHARELAYKAAGDGYRRLLAVGGDGSVHEMFAGVLDWCSDAGAPTEDFTLGVIPIGSGNDWLRSLGVPDDLDKVTDLVASGTGLLQDVVKVTPTGKIHCYMANIGGVGFDSHVCEKVNIRKEKGRRSGLMYVKALIPTILELKKINVAVSGDGELWYEGPCYSVSFGNGRYSGGGLLQTGAAVIDDGLIDVFIVPAAPLVKVLPELPRIFKGTTMDSKRFIYRRAREVKVVPLDEASADIIEVEGELEGHLPVTLTATGQRIRVLSTLS